MPVTDPAATNRPLALRRPHFVTGRLAETALRNIVQQLAADLGFEYSIQVMPITVAALMSPPWIAARLQIPDSASEVILPGYCHGNLSAIAQVTDKPVHLGPRDLRALPEFFGSRSSPPPLDRYTIEIIAEINHAPRMSLSELLTAARSLREAGADVIDVGCEPGGVWPEVGPSVRALRDQGLRVSIDSMSPVEIAAATAAGAELVLSVNSTNRSACLDWGAAEVVVVPDDPVSLAGLDQTIAFLQHNAIPFRIDPIVEPIGCGFAASLGRYLQVRNRFPDTAMMMGIGNLTELTDADSAGINLLLLGFCQELKIHSVLTTQVINWARSSVQECDRARRAVCYAADNGVPPKHLVPELVMLRDAKLYPLGPSTLAELALRIKDHNYRLFAESDTLHLITAGLHLTDTSPFRLFQQLLAHEPRNLDLGHAFYLGYEMAKAATALTLSKQYRQDEALDWGLLTRPEDNRHSPDSTP